MSQAGPCTSQEGPHSSQAGTLSSRAEPRTSRAGPCRVLRGSRYASRLPACGRKWRSEGLCMCALQSQWRHSQTWHAQLGDIGQRRALYSTPGCQVCKNLMGQSCQDFSCCTWTMEWQHCLPRASTTHRPQPAKISEASTLMHSACIFCRRRPGQRPVKSSESCSVLHRLRLHFFFCAFGGIFGRVSPATRPSTRN